MGFNLQEELRKKMIEFQTEFAELEEIEEQILTSKERKSWLMWKKFELLEQKELYWYIYMREVTRHGFSKEIITLDTSINMLMVEK